MANVVDALGAPLNLSVPPWKATLLAALRLEGPGADPLVNIRSGQPAFDPRLLAAARILVARDESEVSGRSLEKLGDLGAGALAKDNESAALRTLSGVCAVALSRFTAALEDDAAALVDGRAPSLEDDAAAPNSSDGAAASGSSTDQQEQQPPALATPLSEDERLALRFRVEKKRILSRAIQSLARALASAQGSSELKDKAAAGVSKKGSKPAPATAKGFGAAGPSKPKP